MSSSACGASNLRGGPQAQGGPQQLPACYRTSPGAPLRGLIRTTHAQFLFQFMYRGYDTKINVSSYFLNTEIEGICLQNFR